MKTIILGIGIVVKLDGKGGGDITSTLKDTDNTSEDEELSQFQYNLAIDGIESLILAHACAGVDIQTPEYIVGIETAVDACANNL